MMGACVSRGSISGQPVRLRACRESVCVRVAAEGGQGAGPASGPLPGVGQHASCGTGVRRGAVVGRWRTPGEEWQQALILPLRRKWRQRRSSSCGGGSGGDGNGGSGGDQGGGCDQRRGKESGTEARKRVKLGLGLPGSAVTGDKLGEGGGEVV
ncbi:methyl-CpG-binding domain protein 2-like [Sarcophilus harrisii]|uniref:methyl-CpG-binding domain protein 2-like n=1 Tax=Sarcophilus harrisii TaxID=9305 RepID=UPI001301C75F|nr:methyl-CpG-binding domain protein 2-like [Sarcophilus harrisii]